MRIVTTSLLSIAILGAAITPGWCPEPADTKSYIRDNTGASAIAVGPTQIYKPSDPRTWDAATRMKILSKEKAAGRIANDTQAKNFIQTGDPNKSYTPPAQKELTKPASMPKAEWDRILATRPKPKTYIQGTPYTSQNEQLRSQGGTIRNNPAMDRLQ